MLFSLSSLELALVFLAITLGATLLGWLLGGICDRMRRACASR